MNSQIMPIVLYLIAAFIAAFGQYCYKLGAGRLGQISILYNWQLFLGMFIFCVVMVLMVAGLKIGGKLSVVYPVYATTFIWGAIIGVVFDKEQWVYSQAIGIGLIVVGVTVVAFGASKV